MGKKAKTQTTTSEPWSVQKPYLEKGFKGAGDHFDSGVAQGLVKDATSGIQRLASQGTPTTDQSLGLMGKTLSGDFLNSNPYLGQAIKNAQQPMIDSFQSATMPSLQSGFARAGRFGSAAQGQAETRAYDSLSRGLGQVAQNMAHGNYEQERGRQMQAAGMSPSLENAQYMPMHQMLQAAGAQQMPYQDYMRSVGGNYGYTQTAPAGTQGGILSGAMGGAQLGSSFGPMGSLIGGGLGGLMGLF